MRTLLENITFVKGIEYLIVIAFCFGFIALWILVNTKDKGSMKNIISAVIPLSMVFAGAAVVVASYGNSEVAANSSSPDIAFPEYYTNGSPPADTPHELEGFRVNSSEYLAIKYGQATEFHKIMSNKVSCSTCHHNSGDEIHACKDCHDAPFNPHDSGKPGLKAAYHQRCQSCHSDDFRGGPESCVRCHNGGTIASLAASAPARPHKLTWETCRMCHKNGIPGGGQETKIVYHDSCLKCHEKGIAGAARVPADHAGRTGNTCSGCHRPAGG